MQQALDEVELQRGEAVLDRGGQQVQQEDERLGLFDDDELRQPVGVDRLQQLLEHVRGEVRDGQLAAALGERAAHARAHGREDGLVPGDALLG